MDSVETESGLYYSDVFEYRDGYLHCEELRVTDILDFLQERNIPPPHTPCFVYSKAKLVANVDSYLRPLQELKLNCALNYAVKANMNISILKLMKNLGCSCTLVSGYELKLCLELGFSPETMVFNGNGKQEWEIEIAVNCGCLLNVDSSFDLRRIKRVCQTLDRRARLLLRVNPGIETNVHKYIVTGTRGSKFGVEVEFLNEVLDEIREDGHILLMGLHCHLGSTITDLNTFRESAIFLSKMLKDMKSNGFPDMNVINIGGGLGIAYTQHATRTSAPTDENSAGRLAEIIPSPADVVKVIGEVIQDSDVTLILEPGRSLVGNTAILATKVLGVKKTGVTNYIVVDGSMTEVIRPALYQAYHHIDLAEPTRCQDGKTLCHVVGPVCESGDFLGKDRLLSTPHEGCCMVVFDVGAYCTPMSSNYNMRPRRAEVLVDKTECTLIRKPDSYEYMLQPYLVQEERLHSPSNEGH